MTVPEPAPTREVTLASLVDNVGAAILEVLAAPGALGASVSEIVIFDSTDPRPVERGDVILAVGIDGSGRDAIDLLHRAGQHVAAAVIVKLDPAAVPQALLEASAESNVALLRVAPDITWGQLHGLLRTACAAAGAPSAVDASGPPVGDLFALANAVSSMVGGATTIEDTRSTVLAYSSTDAPIDEPRRRTILGRRVPDDWLRRLEADGVFRQLGAGGVVRVDYSATDPEYRPRLAVAVRAGGEILGTIWVVQGDRPLDESAEQALAEAGRIAALHILRHRAGDDLERRRRADLLRSVLAERTRPDALAELLGVALSVHVTVLAFELLLDADAPAADRAALTDRAVNAITVHCEAYRRQAASAVEGRVIYVLLPDREPHDVDRLVSFATSVVDHLADGSKLRASVGIGSSVAGLVGVLESRREADRALRTLRRTPTRRVAHIDRVRSAATLLTLQDLSRDQTELRVGKIDRLVVHDRDRGSDYVQTLRAHLDAFGDVGAASAALNVHPNTFRYRLRRLLALAEINLDDPQERLVAHLQLTFLDEVPTDT